MKRCQGCFQDGILEALGDDILLRVLDNLNDTVLVVYCLQTVLLTRIGLQEKNPVAESRNAA